MNDRRAFVPSLLATVLLTAVCVVHLTAGPAPPHDEFRTARGEAWVYGHRLGPALHLVLDDTLVTLNAWQVYPTLGRASAPAGAGGETPSDRSRRRRAEAREQYDRYEQMLRRGHIPLKAAFGTDVPTFLPPSERAWIARVRSLPDSAVQSADWDYTCPIPVHVAQQLHQPLPAR